MAEGYKDWSAGDILTAADLEDYTVKQSVMRFDDSSARTTALAGVLAEGMVSYLKDTNSVEVYDGSAWAAVGPGKILQVVEATHSTHLTIASTSFTDTGLTATITPNAATSKVLVIVSQPFAVLRSLNNTIVGSMQLVRDATNLQDYHAGTLSTGTDTGGNILAGWTQAYTYLDSPATTSAVVYKTQAKANTTANNGRIYANSDGFGNRPSYITLIEVSA